MSEESSINVRIIEGQKKILPLMRRSHRLLKFYIYYSVSILYLWLAWVLFFILWMQLPPELGLIAVVIIALPLIVAPILYKQMKQRYGYILEAQKVLDAIQEAVDSQQIASGAFRYMTLLLNIIKPDESEGRDEGSQIRLRDLRSRLLSQLVVQTLMLYFIFVNFFIPEIISLMETGGLVAVLLNPIIVLMSVIIGIMLTGFVVFLLWELTVRRWLRLYQRIIEWGEEIERMVFSEDQEVGGSEL